MKIIIIIIKINRDDNNNKAITHSFHKYNNYFLVFYPIMIVHVITHHIAAKNHQIIKKFIKKKHLG